MEDLAVFTALNHSGSFGKNLVKFKKNMYVLYRLRVGPYGEKLGPQSPKCCPRPSATGSVFKTSVTVFHHTDLQAGKYFICILWDKNQFDHEGQSRSQLELLVKLSKLPKARGKSEQRLVLVLHLGQVFWPNHRGWWGKTVLIKDHFNFDTKTKWPHEHNNYHHILHKFY